MNEAQTKCIRFRPFVLDTNDLYRLKEMGVECKLVDSVTIYIRNRIVKLMLGNPQKHHSRLWYYSTSSSFMLFISNIYSSVSLQYTDVLSYLNLTVTAKTNNCIFIL